MSETEMPSITSALERELQSVLDKAEIYEIGTYGWVNENDADPEFVGHAMWQLDQPSIDTDSPWDDHAVERRPEVTEKLVVTLGEDFTGLMDASRLSIGLALLWHPKALKDLFSPFFWLHHTDSFLKLAIASDRLRDVLIVSITQAALASYKRRRPKPLYLTPFAEAEALLAARGLSGSSISGALGSLPAFGEQLYGYIRRRNAIVHEVATYMAVHRRDTISELQDRFDREQAEGFVPRSKDPTELIAASDGRVSEMKDEIDRALADLLDWYRLLVRASGNVFEIEYWSRRSHRDLTAR